MGNRNGSSRRKQRDNAYTYTDNRRDEYANNKNGGSINRRSNQPQPPGYQQYPNGYAGAQIPASTNNYPKPSSSKIFCKLYFQ